MAIIKAKVIGYDVPERGPMLKLQIKEPANSQPFVVDSKGQPAKVDVWNEAAMDKFLNHNDFAAVVSDTSNAEQFGSLLVTHVDYIEFHTDRKTVEKDENVYHNYAVQEVSKIVMKGEPSQEKVVSVSKERDNTYNNRASIGQAINLAFQRAQVQESVDISNKSQDDIPFTDYLEKAYNEIMPWIFEKQGLELPESPESEEKAEEKSDPMPWDKTDEEDSYGLVSQEDIW